MSEDVISKEEIEELINSKATSESFEEIERSLMSRLVELFQAYDHYWGDKNDPERLDKVLQGIELVQFVFHVGIRKQQLAAATPQTENESADESA